MLDGRIYEYSILRYLEVAAAVQRSLPVSTIAGQLKWHPDKLNASTHADAIDEELKRSFKPILGECAIDKCQKY